MVIKTDVEKLEKNTVLVNVEVPAEQTEGAIEKAYRDVAKQVRIPGFRKGKAPRAVIDRMVGQEAVLNEALKDILSKVYPIVVEQTGIEPIDQPSIDLVNLKIDEPLVFKATVQVKPEVRLGSYEDLEIEPYQGRPIEEQIEAHFDGLRNQFATLEVIEGRAAKKGDNVLIDYEGSIDGVKFDGGSAADYMLELGSESFIEGFEDQLIGVDAGREAEVKVKFPDDYAAKTLAGKDAVFKVTLKEIKRKVLPELDDEFAKSVSKFETLREFREDIEKTVKERFEAAEKVDRRNKTLEKLAQISELDAPEVMIEQRVDELIEDFAARLGQLQGASLADWLKQTGMTEEQMRAKYLQEAETSVRVELALEEAKRDLAIEVGDDDVERELEKLAEAAKKDVNELRPILKDEKSRERFKERIAVSKTIDFLVSKAKIMKKDDGK